MHLYINLIYNIPCISNSECEVSKMIHSLSVYVKQRARIPEFMENVGLLEVS